MTAPPAPLVAAVAAPESAPGLALDVPPDAAVDAEPAGPRRRGGRPKGPAEAVRTATIGVRVSESEYAALRVKSEAMGMTPAQWLREAALTRRLPSPPVPAVNREHYAELARLSSNLNQLTRLANEGETVVVADGLLERMVREVAQLRLTLIGASDRVGEKHGEKHGEKLREEHRSDGPDIPADH